MRPVRKPIGHCKQGTGSQVATSALMARLTGSVKIMRLEKEMWSERRLQPYRNLYRRESDVLRFMIKRMKCSYDSVSFLCRLLRTDYLPE